MVGARVNKRENPFAQIANSVLRDTRLSFEARGLLAYLLSHIDGWTVRCEVIRAENKIGKEKLQRLFKELESVGYAELRAERENETGRFRGTYWNIFEVPLSRPTENPAAGDARRDKKTDSKEHQGTKYDEEDGEKGVVEQVTSSGFGPAFSPHSSPTICKFGLNVDEWFDRCKEKGLEPCWTTSGHTSFKCLCPVHQEDTPSFCVSKGHTRAVVAHCHGCGRGIEDAGQFLWGASTKNVRGDEMHFVYTDENEVPLYKVCRTKDKTRFWIEVPEKGRWVSRSMPKTQRVLYRLHKLGRAERGQTVYLVEGEKDVESAERRGLLATCNAFGSKGWRSYYVEPLRGRKVVIVADNDAAGAEWARLASESLAGIAASVKVVRTPLDQVGADLSDHFAAGLGTHQLVAA